MSGRCSFRDPLRSLGYVHVTKDLEVETMHNRPVSGSVGVTEGLMIMISKVAEIARLLSRRFSGSLDSEPQTSLRLAGEVHEQSQILTKALVSLQVEEQLFNRLIRFPFRLERVGRMLETILECYRTKALAEITFSENAHREQEQIFALLLDILINLRDALQNPSKQALLAILLQGKRLEEMIREFAGAHWQRVKSGTCAVKASTVMCEILDSAKWANQYVMEMASNLLELGKPQGLGVHDGQLGLLSL
jgi:Na+/phosphate symporter